MSGIARILKWHRLQRDHVELRLSHQRDAYDRCELEIRRIAGEMEGDTVRGTSSLHVLTALQQRMLLDDQRLQFTQRLQTIQQEIQRLLKERESIRREMQRFELLQDEEHRRRKRLESIRLENQLDDFVLRQWERVQSDSEPNPC